MAEKGFEGAALERNATSMSDLDLEGQTQPRGRITYADDTNTIERQTRKSTHIRSRSRDSMSIRSVRRSVDPSIALPPAFRTLSFGIDDSHRRAPKKVEDVVQSKKQASKRVGGGFMRAESARLLYGGQER